MSWHERCMSSFDIESTGVDVETARIVTATIVRICGNQIESREWLLDPGVEIPAEAAAIHGVTTEIAQARGTDAAEGVGEIADELTGAWDRDEPVVIANAPYDLSLLDREMRRHHGHGIAITGTVIDPMCIDRKLDPWRKGKRTLTDLCRHYNVKLEGAHSSAGDALAAARVAWRLAQVYPEYLSRVEDLNDLQTTWRSEWAIDFVKYLERTGKPADDVSGDWPVRPYAETGTP